MVTGGLSVPDGIAVDGNGNIYIGDDQHNRVVKIPAGGGSQTTVGTGLSTQLNVAVDGANNVYISDGGNDQIPRYPPLAGARPWCQPPA